jgi:hypothetical protein
MRPGTGLARAEFALLARPRATSRATDSLYLFESRLLGLHGLLMMRQSEEGKWSILHRGTRIVVEKDVAQRAVVRVASLKTCSLWIRHMEEIEANQ